MFNKFWEVMQATPDPAQQSRAAGGKSTPAPRADARRNIAAILDAALACLTTNPDASVGDIARAAGVGRVTLYGHFNSRAELVDSAFARTVERADEVLDAVDLTGDPHHALAQLINSTWQLVDQLRMLLVAAQRALPQERIRELHDRPMQRVRSLIERGRSEGVFRTDLPASWMVATFYSVLHGAADEITAGRLTDHNAAELITATLLSAFDPPPQPDELRNAAGTRS